jgi:hypothetical protein
MEMTVSENPGTYDLPQEEAKAPAKDLVNVRVPRAVRNQLRDLGKKSERYSDIILRLIAAWKAAHPEVP